MSFVARSTASGFMWLPEPRWSSGPHFEGHRCASAGGCHDWDTDWDTGLTGAVIAARTNADVTAMRGIRLMTGFILIPPRKSVRFSGLFFVPFVSSWLILIASGRLNAT